MTWFSLTSVIDALSIFSPVRFTIVREDEHGAKFRAGNVTKTMTSKNGLFKSGLHPYWGWLIGSVEVLKKSDIVMETDYQSVTTYDEHEVTVTLSVTYKVIDPIKAITAVDDYSDAMSDIICTFVAYQFPEHNLETLKADMPKILETLRNQMNERMASWGILINTIGPNNFTTAPAHRLLSDPILSIGTGE